MAAKIFRSTIFVALIVLLCSVGVILGVVYDYFDTMQAERLRDELRLLEISVWLTNLDELKANARKLELDFRAAEARRDEAQAKLDALYAEGEQYSEKMRQKDMEAETVRAQAGETDGKAAEEESAIAVLESTITHNQENIDRARTELEETDSRAGGLEKQAEEQERRIRRAQQRIADIRAAIALMPPYEKVLAAMTELGAPLTPAECGIDAELLNTSMHCGKDYRTRYTLFKLLDECGLLEGYLSGYPLNYRY